MAKKQTVDLVTLHALLGHYARQHDEVQRVRIAIGNRVFAMEDSGLTSEWVAPVKTQQEELEKLEVAIDRQLTRLVKQHPLGEWITTEAKGLSPRSFGLLFGITGTLDRFATVSKLWKYLGLHVVDGGAPRRVRGQKLDYSPQGRTRCYVIAESIVKTGKGGKYRDAYDTKKAYYEAERGDWPQIRRHRAAMRYAVKELVKDLWIEWRKRVNESSLAEAA